MPNIISEVLYDRIRTSDATLTELSFARGGTDFFARATIINCRKGKKLIALTGRGEFILNVRKIEDTLRLKERFEEAKRVRDETARVARSAPLAEKAEAAQDRYSKLYDELAYTLPAGLSPTSEISYEKLADQQYNKFTRMHGYPVRYENNENFFPVTKSLTHAFFYDAHTFVVHGLADPKQSWGDSLYVYEGTHYDSKWAGKLFSIHGVPDVTKNEPYPFEFRQGGMCGFEELGRAIATNTTLRKIDLMSTDPATRLVDQRDSIALLKGIEHASGVQELILAEADLGEEGFGILCNMLRNNRPPLRNLVINSRDVIGNSDRLAQLQAALRENTTLQTLFVKAVPVVAGAPDVSALITAIQAQIQEQVAGRAGGSLATTEAAAKPNHAVVELKPEWDEAFFEGQIMRALEGGDTKAAEAILDLAVEAKRLLETERTRFVMEISQRYLQEWSAKMTAITRDGRISREEKSFHLTVMRRQVELWTEKYSNAASRPTSSAAAGADSSGAAAEVRRIAVKPPAKNRATAVFDCIKSHPCLVTAVAGAAVAAATAAYGL